MTDEAESGDPKDDASSVGTGDTPATEHPFAGLVRAFKRFLGPFLCSWAVAYVGASTAVDWLHYAGLVGVGVSMMALLIWLIH